jgi:predicted transcriptional regulator
MADEKLVRVFVKISPDVKRRLDVLAAAMQVKSNEAYAGELLTRAVEAEESRVGRFAPAPAPRKSK